MIDLKSLKLTPKPNQHFVAPEGRSTATAHQISPTFNHPPTELARRLRAIISAAPRTTVTETGADGLNFQAVQRSKLFKFPDTITIQILPGPDANASQLALYSRSKYGHSDLGVNKRRVSEWLAALAGEA